MNLTRRNLFRMAAGAPLLLAFGQSSVRAEDAACFDMLSASQKSMRRSLGFEAQSGDPSKRCGSCAFFSTPSPSAACGRCALLSGGPVASTSLCKSWAKKG